MSEQAELYPPPEPTRRRRPPVALIVTAVVVVLAAVAGILVAVLGGGGDGPPLVTGNRRLTVPAHLTGFRVRPVSHPDEFGKAVRKYLAPLTGKDDGDILRHGLTSEFDVLATGNPIVVEGVALRDMPSFAQRVQRDGVDRSLRAFMAAAAGIFRPIGAPTSFDPGSQGGALRCTRLDTSTGAAFDAVGCGWGDESVFAYVVYTIDSRPLAAPAAETRALRSQLER